MQIRKAEPKDCSGVLAIATEVQEFHHLHREDVFTEVEPYSQEFYMSMLTEENLTLLVAVDEKNQIIAYAIFTVNDYSDIIMLRKRHIGMIDDFCVKKSYKRKGIGEALFQKLKELAEEKEVDSIELNIWHFNSEAVEFFKTMGMTEKSHEFELNLSAKITGTV